MKRITTALSFLVLSLALLIAQRSSPVQARDRFSQSTDTPRTQRTLVGPGDARAQAALLPGATTVITSSVDAEIVQGYPAANCTSRDRLYLHVGYDPGSPHGIGGQTVRGLLYFNLARIPPAATIQQATLQIYMNGYLDDEAIMPVTPYRIASTWVPETVTWYHQPPFAEAYPATPVSLAFGRYSFDVTNLVRQWVDGTSPNHGIMLRGVEAWAGWRTFGTSGTIEPPLLSVTYSYEPDFAMLVVPETHVVSPGRSARSALYLNAVGEFVEPVTLSLGGLPAGATYSLDTTTIAPTRTTGLAITTTPGTPLGTYLLTVTGDTTSRTRTVQATLVVTQPSFTLDLSPASASVAPGQGAAYTAHLSPVGDFTSTVTLQAGGLPPGAAHTWSANPVGPAASSTLWITTAPDTPLGWHTIAVTGTGGGITRTAHSTLGVASHTYLPAVSRGYAGAGRTSGAAPMAANQGTVSRIALIVGVSDYAHLPPAVAGTRPKTSGLNYADEDGYDTSLVFMSADGTDDAGIPTLGGSFDPDNVHTLLDRQATKGAIHAEIVNWMAPRVGQDTLVVFFFSGHGMQAPDDDGDEADGYDEYIVPHDVDTSGSWAPETAIRDDELQGWLEQLGSSRVVVIIDTCFSGGMLHSVDDGTIKTLVTGPDGGPGGEAAQVQLGSGFAQDLQSTGYLVLMATAENQNSWEFGALGNGVFTYYLLEGLRSESADTDGNGWISAEEAYAYLASRVDQYVYSQTGDSHQNPQLFDGVPGSVDLIRLGAPPAPCPSW
jgi:hypothetical protein